MHTFSLIVPTFGRTDELVKLFASLENQRGMAIELIVVDQNPDDRVEKVLPRDSPGLTVQYLRQQEPHVSQARNFGLAHATGEFLAFPDDDCVYPPQLLKSIVDWFQAHPEYQIFTSGVVDEQGVLSGNRWPQDSCDLKPRNILRTTQCVSLFLRRAPIPATVRFDTAIRHGEETDFILHLMKTGCRGRFDRSLKVIHPRRDMLSGTVSHQRAMQYGEGMGRLVRRHSLSTLWGGLLTYGVLRTVLVAAKGDVSGAGFCLSHTRGLLRGFLFPYRGNYQPPSAAGLGSR